MRLSTLDIGSQPQENLWQVNRRPTIYRYIAKYFNVGRKGKAFQTHNQAASNSDVPWYVKAVKRDGAVMSVCKCAVCV